MMTKPMNFLRFAFRQLLKSPSFTLIATLTLALGIGANSAIFSIINAAILHPFPYPDSERIAQLGEATLDSPGNGMVPITYPDFLDWRAQSKSFEHIAWITGQRFALTGSGEPIYVKGARTSSDLWQVLGMQPALGKVFDASMDRLGATPTCVISHALWVSSFNSDPSVLGRNITLEGRNYTVLGVMPPSFKFWGADVWTPAALDADTPLMKSRILRNDFWAVGKLAPGQSLESALQELNIIAKGIAERFPETNKNIGAAGALLMEQVTSDIRPTLQILFAAVIAVLLIACLNVANLLLAKHAARAREFSVRAAMGASRGRMISQLLLENVPLAILGGLVGTAVAYGGLYALQLIIPPGSLPSEANISVDTSVLLFTAAISLGSVVIFGMIASLGSVRKNAAENMRSMTVAGNKRGGQIRAGLIVIEVSLAFVLLICSALLIRSFDKLSRVSMGFDTGNLLLAPVNLPESRYPQPLAATQFFQELMQRAKTLPGVKNVAASTTVPMLGNMNMPLVTEGQSYERPEQLSSVNFNFIMGDYFATQGMQLKQGRAFNATDRAGAEPVIIINEAAAKKFLAGKNPLNQRVMLGLPEKFIKPGMLPEGLDKFEWSRVVGVVNDVKLFSLQQQMQPAVYVPIDQAWTAMQMRQTMTLLLRTQGDPYQVAPGVRQLLLAQDSQQPLQQLTSMDDVIATQRAGSKFSTIVLSTFGAIALLLACVGVYGVVAWNFTQRTRESGIRMALGAQKSNVEHLLLRQGLKIVGMGLLIGMLLSWAATRLLQSLLFEIGSLDPLSFSLVPSLLFLVAALACWLPTRKVSTIELTKALRSE
jgi:putative ABC transport system permease protein